MCVCVCMYELEMTGKVKGLSLHAWPQKSAGPLPGIQGGAVTRLRVDNTIFDGCSLQILGKEPFLLGQQSDDVGAGTGLGSLRSGELFILETHRVASLGLLM